MGGSKRHELGGRRFGRLAVIDFAEMRGREVMWLCACECGNALLVRARSLASGNTKSCGCYRRYRGRLGVNQLRHGASRRGALTPEYVAWMGMQNRCYNPNHDSFQWYGGRGVTVAREWRGHGGFERFLAHIGPKPTHFYSLDRIDPDGNYEPGNVRWATRKQQRHNRRRSP